MKKKRIILGISILLIVLTNIFLFINNQQKELTNSQEGTEIETIKNDTIAANDNTVTFKAQTGITLSYKKQRGVINVNYDNDTLKSFSCSADYSSCTVTVIANVQNGYTFTGWTETGDCNNIVSNKNEYMKIFNNTIKSITYTACAREIKTSTNTGTTPATTTTTKKKTAKSNNIIAFKTSTGIASLSDVVFTNKNNITITNDSNTLKSFSCNVIVPNCGIYIKAIVKDGYTFTGWTETGNCNNLISNNEALSKEFDVNTPSKTYTACAQKTANITNNNFATCTNKIYGKTTYKGELASDGMDVQCGKSSTGTHFRCWEGTCSNKSGEKCTFYDAEVIGCADSTISSQQINLTISSQTGIELSNYKINKKSLYSSPTIESDTSTYKSFICNGSTGECNVSITAKEKKGYTFRGWSKDKCKNIVSTSKEITIDFGRYTTLDYVACVGGSGSTSIGNAPTVTEPVAKDTFTFNYNDYVYAKGNEYQGETIKCGDKLYISVCTNDNDPICKVTSINGNSVSNTQIRKSNFVKNESETGCFNEITRYIKEKTYYFSNSNLSEGKTEIGCGATVTFKESIDKACSAGSCKVYYNNNLVYISNDKIVSDKPVCDNSNENVCVTSDDVKNVKDSTSVKICKKDDNENKRNSIVTCAEDYEKSYKLITDTCDNNKDDCYKEYKYTCNYVKRPGVSATAGILKSNGYGTLSITGQDNGNIGLKGYYISNGDTPTENSNWISFSSNNSATIEKTAGTYFIWTMNNKNRLSYQVMAKVYDSELSTTLSSVNITDENGENVSINSLDSTIGYTGELVDEQYALLSNSLIADTKIGGFDKLTTAYEISVASNKVAIYTTLTSSDASYVSGYEPRTIDLDYGRNVALIKIVNKNGRERTYTFIINRVDDRSNSNILNDITLSKGKIDFDPYTTNYTVKISKSTKLVSVNAELNSQTASFIKYYEPREVQISEDVQSVVLKVISEAGSIRSYVITFIKSDIKDDSKNSSYLSSLTVPGTQLGFDKETYDYTITVPYDTESIPIYAFAESEKATVTIGNNTGLKVGNNLIEIEVKNGSNIKVYNLHVIRKESGLDIANSAKLGLLSIKNYNIDFNPDILDYIVKIKREKSLLITASPESNRADIYMYGNNDLTGFSTVRVKVIAENGLTNIYSIDIQKASYNKKIEVIAAISGGIIVITTCTIILIRKRRKKMKEYLEG